MFNSLFGIPVVFSDNAVQVTHTQNKVHKRRHNQSPAYHRRVDKKWRKRYGTTRVETPCAYRLGKTGITGEMFIMHTSLRASLEHHLKSSAQLQANMARAYRNEFPYTPW